MTTHFATDYFDSKRRMRQEIFDLISSQISDSECHLVPFFYPASGKVDWATLKSEDWSVDEQLALQWLRTLLDDEMHVKTHPIYGVFPFGAEMAEAIIRAIAIHRYSTYLLREPITARYAI